jgi:hypothetical protein
MTVTEACVLFINLICNKYLLFTPEYIRNISQSGVLLTVLVMFITIFIFWQLILKKNIFSNERLTYASLILLIVLVVFSALNLRQYAEIAKTISLEDSSLYFIEGIFIIAMIAGAKTGLKGLCKACLIFVPFIFISLLALVFFASTNLDFYNIFPIMGKGIKSTFLTGVFLVSSFMEFALFPLMASSFKSRKEYEKSGNIILVSSFIIIMIITVFYTASFTDNISFEKYPPVFQIIRLFNSGTYFQRFDSLFLIMYSLSAYLYLGSVLYFAVFLFSKTFGIKRNKYLVVPLAIIIISFSFINILSEVINSYVKYANLFLWTVPTILPLFIKRRI